MALQRVDVAFEFLEKLGCDFYCFHDRDVAPEAASLAECNNQLDTIADRLEEKQKETGKKLLWGTANLFSHQRSVHGAATSPHVESFAYAPSHV